MKKIGIATAIGGIIRCASTKNSTCCWPLNRKRDRP